MKKHLFLSLVFGTVALLGSAASSAAQCNWWGSFYPVCSNSSQPGWGWENGESCITADIAIRNLLLMVW